MPTTCVILSYNPMSYYKITSIVTLCASGTQFDYPPDGSNLLDVLELHKIPVEYQCRAGYCGSCRIRLVKGQVAWCQRPLASIQYGEILACCCQPLGDIEIEI